jgi:SAM-dependent methyltransferase
MEMHFAEYRPKTLALEQGRVLEIGDRALAEIHRVLRPGGQLIFVEHVRWEDPERAKWQDRLERPWMVLADGCHSDRATLERIEAGPFDVVDVERTELKQSLPLVRPLVRPLVAGRALARKTETAS